MSLNVFELGNLLPVMCQVQCCVSLLYVNVYQCCFVCYFVGTISFLCSNVLSHNISNNHHICIVGYHMSYGGIYMFFWFCLSFIPCIL